MFIAPLAALMVGFARLAAPAVPNETPAVTSTFVAPTTPPAGTPNRIGPFIAGPDKPFELSSEDKAKLDDLAVQYRQVAIDNYPLIIKTLKLEDKPASTKQVRIVVTFGYDGVAATSGTPQGPRIEVGAKYALAHPKDLGMIVHEMVHVVQSYKHYNDTDAPGWLVEGIADYVRWFYYEALEKRPHPHGARADARGSYQTTAAFLFWVANKYNPDLVPKLNAALQDNSYHEPLFKDLTGKTLDDLNAEWKASLS